MQSSEEKIKFTVGTSIVFVVGTSNTGVVGPLISLSFSCPVLDLSKMLSLLSSSSPVSFSSVGSSSEVVVSDDESALGLCQNRPTFRLFLVGLALEDAEEGLKEFEEDSLEKSILLKFASFS